MSQRGAARYFGIDPHRGQDDAFRCRQAIGEPTAGAAEARAVHRIIDQILDDDGSIAAKQRHTAKRIFERLRDERAHGYGRLHDGQGITCGCVGSKGARCSCRCGLRRAMARRILAKAVAVIGGVAQKVHLFVMDLPKATGFVKAYRGRRRRAFLDGHVSAFAFFGGVPRSILYDNTKLAVARVLGAGKRQRTRAFSELTSHYLFEDRFGRPGKGNGKGQGRESDRLCPAQLSGAAAPRRRPSRS